MYNCKLQDQGLKIKWLNRLLCAENTFWHTQVTNCFLIPVRYVLKINISFQSLKALIKPNKTLPPFWESVFQI